MKPGEEEGTSQHALDGLALRPQDSVRALGLTVRTNNCLANARIRTVGDLILKTEDELLYCNNFGRLSLADTTAKLATFGLALGMTPDCAFMLENRPKEVAEETAEWWREPQRPKRLKANSRRMWYFSARNRSRLCSDAKALTLRQIHLRTEVDHLEAIGVHTLDDLLGLFEAGLPPIRSLGRKSIERMYQTVTAIDISARADGSIDWSNFARALGIRMVPPDHIALGNGAAFLASLGGFVEELMTHCFEPIESAILQQRLVQTTGHAETLASLGKRFRLSRERIRQKQKAVLRSISAAALDDEYEGRRFRLSSTFSEYWKLAAKHFGSSETLSYADFIEGLSSAWSVPSYTITPHLPLIYLVLTSSGTLPSDFKADVTVPASLFRLQLSAEQDRPVTSLNLSRSLARILAKKEVLWLRVLLVRLLQNRLSLKGNKHLGELQEITDALAAAVTDDNSVSWERYATLRGLTLLPATDDVSPAQFAVSVVPTIREFIAKTKVRHFGLEIFSWRLVPSAAERRTIERVGQLTGISWGDIQLRERVLLQRLAAAVFESVYTDSKARFRESFQVHWNFARRIYVQYSELGSFTDQLAKAWGLPSIQVAEIAPLLTAIIAGAPIGYTGLRYLSSRTYSNLLDTGSSAAALPDISAVRLRGFRRIH